MTGQGVNLATPHLPCRTVLAPVSRLSMGRILVDAYGIAEHLSSDTDGTGPPCGPRNAIPLPKVGAPQVRAPPCGDAWQNPHSYVQYDTRLAGQTLRTAEGNGPPTQRGFALTALKPDPRPREGVPTDPRPPQAAVPRHAPGARRRPSRGPDPL